MKAFVTGGTGFVGSAVVRALLHEGYAVRALVRKESDLKNLKGLDVEFFYGDLCDRGSLKKGLTGCAHLFHVAAHYELWHKDRRLPYRVNVEGTVNLFTEAVRAGVEKAVYTSSVSTVGICAREKIGREHTPVDSRYIIGHYKQSKYLAEKEVLNISRKGFHVVVVNPSTPVGARDIKPTPTGKVIVDYLNRRMAGYIETGLNVIDVEDVARGHILALRKGRPGDRYILGHKNLTLQEIFRHLEKVSGIPAPKMKIPYAVALCAGYADHALSLLLKRKPFIPLDGVRMAKKKMFFDAAKAVRELGLPQSPVEGAFRKACEWFRQNGYVKT
jgi:dihydroflavonol-4-reductase